MKKHILVFLIVILAACDPGDIPPPNSFQIRFANILGFDGTQFAIGPSSANLASESGSLATDEITGYSYVTTGTYFLYIDNGSGWQLNDAYVLGAPGTADSCAFETGKRYEYGTNGGGYMYVIEN